MASATDSKEEMNSRTLVARLRPHRRAVLARFACRAVALQVGVWVESAICRAVAGFLLSWHSLSVVTTTSKCAWFENE